MSKNFYFSAIRKNVAGIFQISQHFLVSQSLKGYKKNFVEADSPRPMTLDMLKELCRILLEVCKDSYEVLLFRSAFILAFFAALRISEFVAANKKAVSNLKLSDIIHTQHNIKIFISRSKNDQYSKGSWLTINALVGSPICPVNIINQYLAFRPVHSGSFFIHSDKSILTNFQFNALPKKYIVRLNLVPFFSDRSCYRSGSIRFG